MASSSFDKGIKRLGFLRGAAVAGSVALGGALGSASGKVAAAESLSDRPHELGAPLSPYGSRSPYEKGVVRVPTELTPSAPEREGHVRSHTLRFALGLCASLATALVPVCGFAAQFQQGWAQAEQRDATGRIVVEASTIYPFRCNGAGENGPSYYLYQYRKRLGFRVIRPPAWARPIGGRDFTTWQAAIGVACGTSGPTIGRGRIPPVSTSIPACASPVGSWAWWNGGTVSFAANGTATHPAGSTGEWQLGNNGTYHVHWGPPLNSDDYFTISADGSQMLGNYAGTHGTSHRNTACQK